MPVTPKPPSLSSGNPGAPCVMPANPAQNQPHPKQSQATEITDAGSQSPNPQLPSENELGPSGENDNQATSSAATSGLKTGKGQRDTFSGTELAIVLSHYDLGVIQGIKVYPRGSRRSPKVLVKTGRGNFLLKRRACGRDDPFKVAFSHQIQLTLIGQQFPLPHLVGTRADNNSMLQWQGGIYELFAYIKGTGYDSSLQATGDAGKILAVFHKLLKAFTSDYEPATGSYHAVKLLGHSMRNIPKTLKKVDEQYHSHAQQIKQLMDLLTRYYQEAAQRVTQLGLDDWPQHIGHGDWHPGNMLFRGPRVVAVIDYDSARLGQRVIDIANGALQFSILGGKGNPASWPSHVDLPRFKQFMTAYESVPGGLLSKAELQAIPWLMAEALIAESVIPIANTGFFAHMAGFDFLQMVQQKVHWIREHADELIGCLEG